MEEQLAEPNRKKSPGRKIFHACILIAIPGMLWSAFEAYALTLWSGHGHMLFFWAVHAAPPLFLAVIAAMFALALLVVQSAAALLLPSYRKHLAMGYGAVALIALPAIVHWLLLMLYEQWSRSDIEYIIPACALGLAAVATFLIASGKLLREA